MEAFSSEALAIALWQGELMNTLSISECGQVQRAIDGYIGVLAAVRISLCVRHNFRDYAAIRHSNGDTHLNQAFDPVFTASAPTISACWRKIMWAIR
jgi:hypothetical protein